MPKDDTTASSAPANSIYNYQAHIKSVDIAPSPEHTDPRIYRVGDAVWVKTPHGNSDRSDSPHSVLINETPHYISRDLHSHQRFALLEDNGSDKSSESDSDSLLFFSTGPHYSSMEPAETDAGDNDEREQVGTNAEETGRARPPLRRSTQRWLPSLCDQEICEDCRKEKTTNLMWQSEHVYAWHAKWVKERKKKYGCLDNII